MVPAASRMRRRCDFATALRHGRRAGRPLLSAHLHVAADPAPAVPGYADGDVGSPPLVGFTVSRRVGNAPVRNRVRRRLRELVRARLDAVPAGALLVVRAAPAAATASYADLGTDLDRVLDRLLASGPA